MMVEVPLIVDVASGVNDMQHKAAFQVRDGAAGILIFRLALTTPA